MKKGTKRNIIPDLTEFTDEDGKKWIQTSADDLFSMKELNDILESIDKEKEKDEVVLARIDFQKVNREYYDAALALQTKLTKQTELLKKLAEESKKTIERKNYKLKELIEYIKKLHMFIAYINANQDRLDEIEVPDTISFRPVAEVEDVAESVYEEVEEVVIPND
jgi:hypothetical protein